MSSSKESDCYVTDQIRIKSVPEGMVTKDHFEILKNVKIEGPKKDELLIESLYLSVDPYQRLEMGTWIKDNNRKVMAFTIGKVIKSGDDKYKEGDIVTGHFTWDKKQIVKIKDCIKLFPDVNKVKTPHDKDYEAQESKDSGDIDLTKIELSYFVGSMGMPGQTAYFGMINHGGLKKGDNVFITGAAGAVGSMCGQIAKVYGCHTVGTAGSKEKIDWLTKELGFDGAFNYKGINDVKTAQDELKKQFPNGIDFYWDNTGGVLTDAVWDLLNKNARVVICGQITQYNARETPKVDAFLSKLIYKSITIKGFIVFDYLPQYLTFYKDMGRWILDGKIKVKDTVINGFENTVEAFIGLFSGKNIGKMVVKC